MNLGKIYIIVLIAFLFILGCEDDSPLNLDKCSYCDYIADITYLNGSFYTTNYDLSGNAGSQIDLFKYIVGENGHVFINDKFDLEMNGQGYISITNDGSDLYLQSRHTGIYRKYSTVGDLIFTAYDTISTNWQSCGITYLSEKDSLLTLYRNLNILTQYRARIISKDNLYQSSMDTIFHFDFIDTTYHGIYAIANKDLSFYMLGVDTSMTDILLITDENFYITKKDTILDNSVVGLDFFDDDLFFSYRDKRIQLWKTY